MHSNPIESRPTSGDPVHPARNAVPLAVAAALVLAACAAAGAMASTGLIGLDILRKTFDHAAAKNYGEAYKENADDLFQALAKPASEKPAAAAVPETLGSVHPDPTAAATAPAGASAPATPTETLASSTSPAATTTSVPAAKSEDPLALEVGIYKEVVAGERSMPVPVQDGEVLFDGYGSHGVGEQIKFMFRANCDAYVYVISIDGTGWIQPIFPGQYSTSKNPVRANQTYLFPEGTEWAPLDSYRGVEHLYFLAGRSPRPDLEKSLAAFADRTRGVDPGRSASVAPALAQVSEGAPLMRGFEAPRPSQAPALPSSGGEGFPVDTQLFVSNGAGEIVVTRWFRHE